MDSRYEGLSASQLHAMFDLLTDSGLYEEIASLKYADNIRQFGPPLQNKSAVSRTSSPLLTILLRAFILDLPGLSSIDATFWEQNIVNLLISLDESNLSESYDKGTVGIRRMLSTATAAIAEAVARGALGGVDNQIANSIQDCALNGAQLEASWDIFIRQSIYSDMIDDLAVKIADTQELSQHSALVQAAHKYVLLMSSSFLHYIFVVSPRGQSMLSLIIKAHELVPYYLIRQTLKIGNVASMLNAMLKIILAKMNASAIVGWFGYGKTTESGMNLLQYIISSVLQHDMEALKKKANKIKEDFNISAETCNALSDYCNLTKEQQELLRSQTSEDESLIDRIFANAGLAVVANSHEQPFQDYLVARLSIRDREKLVETLCQHDPDLLSSTIRTIVSAYEPIIRELHKAVDLSSGVLDLQNFLTDLIKLSRVPSGVENTPTVEDFFKLLEQHAKSCHRFLHQTLKNSPHLRQEYRMYAKEAMTQYRQTIAQDGGAAGDVTGVLKEFYNELQPEEQLAIRGELDAHADELVRSKDASSHRLAEVVENLSKGQSGSQVGPGMYLQRWQKLMEKRQLARGLGHSQVASGKRPCENVVQLIGPKFVDHVSKLSRDGKSYKCS